MIKGLVINRFKGLGGIFVEPGVKGTRVEGNFIGTDPGGAIDRGNAGSGVSIGGVTGGNNTVGGRSPAARNLISGNDGQAGVVVASSRNRVQGNLIGTQKDGASALGNSGSGVVLANSSNTVGVGSTNVIASNGQDGVRVLNSSSTGNRILFNRIRSNSGLGIDLGGDGVTPNDPKDPDTGPNNLQNFPDISSAVTSGGSTTIRGSLNSTPGKTYTIQFFGGPVADPTGFGEGETFLGQKKVKTNKLGNRSFTFTTNRDLSGQFITATATGPGGNTSEFSQARSVS